jgi:predicted small lipoprotein YifL
VRKLIAAALAAALTLGLAACGEKTQVTVYEPGKYKGKLDAKPWDNEQFKGNQAAWEDAVKARSLAQNEYVRTQQ